MLLLFKRISMFKLGFLLKDFLIFRQYYYCFFFSGRYSGPKVSNTSDVWLKWRSRFAEMGNLLAEVAQKSPNAFPQLQQLIKMNGQIRQVIHARSQYASARENRRRPRMSSSSFENTLLTGVASNLQAMHQCDAIMKKYPGTAQAEVASLLKDVGQGGEQAAQRL